MALIFMDLDGTLLYHGTPADDVGAAVRALKQNGHVPIIATGRTPRLMYGIEKVLKIDSYIAANGGYICYHGNVMRNRPIDRDVLRRFLRRADELGMDVTLEGVAAYVAHRKETDLVHKFSDVFEIEYPEVDRSFHKHHDVLAMVVFSDEHIERLKKEFPELTFNRSNKYGYDVNPAGRLKADGMEWLVDHLGYPADQVYAIGDGFNDIEMLKAAHIGIAMGNAFDPVKEAADYVTDPVDARGITNALRHFSLIEGD